MFPRNNRSHNDHLFYCRHTGMHELFIDIQLSMYWQGFYYPWLTVMKFDRCLDNNGNQDMTPNPGWRMLVGYTGLTKCHRVMCRYTIGFCSDHK